MVLQSLFISRFNIDVVSRDCATSGPLQPFAAEVYALAGFRELHACDPGRAVVSISGLQLNVDNAARLATVQLCALHVNTVPMNRRL